MPFRGTQVTRSTGYIGGCALESEQVHVVSERSRGRPWERRDMFQYDRFGVAD